METPGVLICYYLVSTSAWPFIPNLFHFPNPLRNNLYLRPLRFTVSLKLRATAREQVVPPAYKLARTTYNVQLSFHPQRNFENSSDTCHSKDSQLVIARHLTPISAGLCSIQNPISAKQKPVSYSTFSVNRL